MCDRRKWLPSVDSEKKKKLDSYEEKRRWEKLKIKLSPSKEDPSSDEEYEELKFWRTFYPSYYLDKKWWMKKMMKLKTQEGVYPWNK